MIDASQDSPRPSTSEFLTRSETVGNHRQRLLLTAAEAAEALQVSPRKLWSLTADGTVPHVRIGRTLRYPIAALQQWVREQTYGGER
jgi:excisionase family DNA binding protein